MMDILGKIAYIIMQLTYCICIAFFCGAFLSASTIDGKAFCIGAIVFVIVKLVEFEVEEYHNRYKTNNNKSNE